MANRSVDGIQGPFLPALYDSAHMGRISQDGNFVCFVSHKNCWTAVAKLISNAIFIKVF